jgi:hypothetical protein
MQHVLRPQPHVIGLHRAYGVPERFELRRPFVDACEDTRRFPFLLRGSWSGRPSNHERGKPINARTHPGCRLVRPLTPR